MSALPSQDTSLPCPLPAAATLPSAPAPGCGRLGVDWVQGRSTLVTRWAASPLTLLTPRPRASCVWAYAGTLGGGLVAGDRLELDIQVGPGARACVGSQSSTKGYPRLADRRCQWTTRAEVAPGGLLVLAPDPVQAFAGAHFTQRQEFRLAPHSGLVLLDWFTAGRSACGERWAFEHFHSRNALWHDAGEPQSEPDFLDAVLLDSRHGRLAERHRMGRFECVALLVFTGAPLQEAATQLLRGTAELPVQSGSPLIRSASPMQHGAMLRIAGEEVQAVTAEIRLHLAMLAPLLDGEPWARRP